MAKSWKTVLRIDPLPDLRSWPDPALAFFIRRDLLVSPLS